MNPFKRYIAKSPYLTVSTILYLHGPIHSNQIWSIYQENREKYMLGKDILSKSYLKREVIPKMLDLGMVKETKINDLAQKSTLGWELLPRRAFKDVSPEILERIGFNKYNPATQYPTTLPIDPLHYILNKKKQKI
jgi:hypothetical protein